MKIEVHNQVQSSQEGFWRDAYHYGIFSAIARSILSNVKRAEKSAKIILTADITDESLSNGMINARGKNTISALEYKKFIMLCTTLDKISDALSMSMKNFDTFNGNALLESFKSFGYKVSKDKVKNSKLETTKTEKVSTLSQNLFVIGNIYALPLSALSLILEATSKRISLKELGWTTSNIKVGMRKFLGSINEFKNVAKYNDVLKTAIHKDMTKEEKKIVAKKVELLKSAIDLYKDEMRNVSIFVSSLNNRYLLR